MKVRSLLAAIAGMAISVGILTPTTALAVNPGSVTPTINTTPGSGSFSFHASAAGWYRGTITVSYTMYDGPSAAGPWAYYYGDSHTCSNSTSCGTNIQYSVCSNGWYKMVAHANGPGGNAENNGATVVKYVWGTLMASVPQVARTSLGMLVPTSISSECTRKTTPI